jgi:hypothetical protein
MLQLWMMMNKKEKKKLKKKKLNLFFSPRVKKYTMINQLEFAINTITEQITGFRNQIEYHENLRETILDIKRLDLNIAFLKNKLKSHQISLMGLRSCFRSDGLQLQLLVIERLKEYITERQEIVQEISDNGYADDGTYNNHCLFHRDVWAILNR